MRSDKPALVFCLGLWLASSFAAKVLPLARPTAIATPLNSTLLLGSRPTSHELTYAELTNDRTPSAYQQALGLVDLLTPRVGPGEVKALRVSVLHARELLDIFAYAYPPSVPQRSQELQMDPTRCRERKGACDIAVLRSAQLDAVFAAANLGRQRDVWQSMRDDLEEGYRLLGDFQDLDHSLVDFDDADAMRRRDACLRWRMHWLRNHARLGYKQLVRGASDAQLYDHKHLSKFFWAHGSVRPAAPGLPGMRVLRRMVHEAQLSVLVDTYGDVMALGSVWREPEHTEFHNFRKLVRSILSVFELFPTLATSSSSSSSRRVLIGRDDIDTAIIDHRHYAQDCPDSADGVVALLWNVFHDLGKVNDAVFAYDFYTSKGPEWQAEAEEALRTVQARWAAEVEWMQEHKVDRMVQCLADMLQQ